MNRFMVVGYAFDEHEPLIDVDCFDDIFAGQKKANCEAIARLLLQSCKFDWCVYSVCCVVVCALNL